MIRSFKLLSVGGLASLLIGMADAIQPPYPYQYVEPYIQTFTTISAYTNGFYFPLDPITDRRPSRSRSHHSRSRYCSKSKSCSRSRHSWSEDCSSHHSHHSETCHDIRPSSDRRSRSFFNGHHKPRRSSICSEERKPCGCVEPCRHTGNGFSSCSRSLSCKSSRKSRSCSYSTECSWEPECTSIDYRRINGYRSDWSCCEEEVTSLCPVHSTTECPCPPPPCPPSSCPCQSSSQSIAPSSQSTTTSQSVAPTSQAITTSQSVAPTSQSIAPTSGIFCPPVTVTVTHVPSAYTTLIVCEPVIPNCHIDAPVSPIPQILDLMTRSASVFYTTSAANSTTTSSTSSSRTTVSGQQANAAIPVGSNVLGNSLMVLFFTIALIAFLA